MSLDNPHACYWCRQQPCKGGSGNGSCTRREGAADVSDAKPVFSQVRSGILTLSGDTLYVRTRPTHEYGEQVEMSLGELKLLLSRAGLALVPAADVQPISDETLRHLRECALAWEPEACLLGNVTAHQLRAFCLELAKRRVLTPEDRAVLEEAYAAGFRTAHENATGCETNHIFGFDRWLLARLAAKDPTT